MDESIDQIQNTNEQTPVQSSIFNSMRAGFSILLPVAFLGNLITPYVFQLDLFDHDLIGSLGAITCGLLLSEFPAIAHWQVFDHASISIRF
jgi:hypothetical protein